MLKVNKWSFLSLPWFWCWVVLSSSVNCFSFSKCFLVCQTDSGNGWKWVDESDIDHSLFPQSYRPLSRLWPHHAWWSKTTFSGEGPHCLVIQPWVDSAKNQWEPKRCAYTNYFMCKLPKSAVVPTYTGPITQADPVFWWSKEVRQDIFVTPIASTVTSVLARNRLPQSLTDQALMISPNSND